MARALGLTVVAEGIESRARLAELMEVRWRYARGLLFDAGTAERSSEIATRRSIQARLRAARPWRGADSHPRL